MNETSSAPVYESGETPRNYRVDYVIQDGEYEYGDTFVLKGVWDSVKEEAYKKVAEIFACDSEEEQEIVDALRAEDMAMIGCRMIKDIAIHVVEAVTVIVSGGVVQDIRNIPEGESVRVIDYDVDNLTAEELSKADRDENGCPCSISEWEGR